MERKMLINFLSALAVLALIMLVTKVVKTNYDPRLLKSATAVATVLDKSIKPAGTTPIYRSIGGQIRAIPVRNEEEPTIFIQINGITVSGVVDHLEYQNINIDNDVTVTYLKPKYWGKPIVIDIRGN